RVEALESQITEVRSTLTDVQNHVGLIATLEKCLGKSVITEEGSASASVQGSPTEPVVTEKIVQHSTVLN
ncbi:hypothetical protein A2U01_0112404, partial [Trifolium medium]|nr:hypothetical protein [Trifolium medium]